MKRRPASTATSPIGTLMNRIHCQPSTSVSTPPTSAPAAPPAAPIAPHNESARLRSAPSVNVVVRTDNVAGATTAPPRPWNARATISWPCPWDSPPARDAAANSRSPASRTFLCPSRSAARPPSSRKPANVIVYAFTTHCRSTTENPRSPRIDGSATFTTDTSRMTMNWARQQRTRVHRFVTAAGDCTGNHGSVLRQPPLTHFRTRVAAVEHKGLRVRLTPGIPQLGMMTRVHGVYMVVTDRFLL